MVALVTEGLSYWAVRSPHRPALVFDGTDVVDYVTLDRWTDAAAASLEKSGLRPGDRIGLVGANSLEWCAAAIGALKLGAIVVPFNNRFTAPELALLVQDCEPSMVLADHETRGRMTDALDGSSVRLRAIEDFAALRDESRSTRFPQRPRDADDIAMIIYTSGSTAAPKGVVYTHRCVYDFISELAISEPALRPGARIIYMLSMSGAPGLPWHILQPLARGMTVFYEKGFDAPTILRRLVDERVEMMSGVPMQFERLAALPEFRDADLSALQLCTIAGARVPLPTIAAWQAKGVLLRQAYGMTELCGLSSVNPSERALTSPDSIGRGSVFMRHRVVRADGTDCPPGEPGEIVVRGPAMSPGYWRNPEATAALFRDGWLHTGDVGVCDEDGYLQIVDRMKDLIISGGYNIAPSEIEAVINELSGVVEVCVIAVDDHTFGETPAAIIHADQAVTPVEVIDWCRPRMASYKLPRYVVMSPEPLPRMTSGKIARRMIRDDHSDIADRHPRLR